MSPYQVIKFIFIPWICTGLQNPYVYGNGHVCLRSQEQISVQTCRPSTIFEVLT